MKHRWHSFNLKLILAQNQTVKKIFLFEFFILGINETHLFVDISSSFKKDDGEFV